MDLLLRLFRNKVTKVLETVDLGFCSLDVGFVLSPIQLAVGIPDKKLITLFRSSSAEERLMKLRLAPPKQWILLCFHLHSFNLLI